MCVVELYVTLLPCRHRWYHLLRPCSPTTNLSNCPEKVGIEGWEIKVEICPYCSQYHLSNTDYRLLGIDCSQSVGESPSPSLNLGCSRRSSSRRASLPRSDSQVSIQHSDQVSLSEKISKKNKDINRRVDVYLGGPNDRKNSISEAGTLDGGDAFSAQGSVRSSVCGRSPSTDDGNIMAKADRQVISGKRGSTHKGRRIRRILSRKSWSFFKS